MSEALREADYRVTIEAFRAFYDERPKGEKWELIDGEVLLNPAPNSRHQRIVRNVLFLIEATRLRSGAAWDVFPGIGVTNPHDDHNQPEPDVMITPAVIDVASWTSEILVAFEILSPFTKRRDLMQKRDFYTSHPDLTHYIVIAQDRREVTVFARADNFTPSTLTDADVLQIPQLGAALPLADIYRDILPG